MKFSKGDIVRFDNKKCLVDEVHEETHRLKIMYLPKLVDTKDMHKTEWGFVTTVDFSEVEFIMTKAERDKELMT